ncbi:hypothetical protein JIR001_25930 [Polycladomyces abyssicola]|uniref:Uncharacterized protein n=1 Tax=Polycladomyces abyssicola TaxID=1125966 RepID=A0A8D5UJ94_9BACL|nr:hypothetical protein [Polycladomyces abyssicola]BCU82810.1 hypothetical protein JIR001_25930 [Polycladomyces abyssicola]
MKEKDLNEDMKEALKYTGVNDFVQFHAGDHDVIVWLKERKWTKKPYEAVKDQVKTDYIMDVSKSMKEEYINELATKYGLVVNTKYFSQTINSSVPDTKTHTGHEHHH